MGDKDSGWMMHVSPTPQVCYCAGVGQGISFEMELAKMSSRPVLVFDPSPTGIATIKSIHAENLEFFPVGMAAVAGVVEFSEPVDSGEGSYSVARDGIRKVSFECWDLPTIMRKKGDLSIDLLKMDIEGFEYDIVDRMLRERIPVRQLLVEFHPWLRPGRTWKTIARLHGAGYRILHKHRGDHTFLLKEAAYRERMAQYRPTGTA